MWKVAIGAYSLKQGEIGKVLPEPDIQRVHEKGEDALLDLEQAIDKGEGHMRGWPMGCTYRVIDPSGKSLSFNQAYLVVFGEDHVSEDNKPDKYPHLRKWAKSKVGRAGNSPLSNG